jgi:hypothetical protein
MKGDIVRGLIELITNAARAQGLCPFDPLVIRAPSGRNIRVE